MEETSGKKAHASFESAIRHVASVIGKSAEEVRAAIDEFYSRVTARKVMVPRSGVSIETTVVKKPDTVPPILTGPSVVLEVAKRKPIEIGVSSHRQLDKEKQEMVEMTRVAVRRMEGTVAPPREMREKRRAR